MSFNFISLMIWSRAILPILMLSLFFLFVSSFRNGSCSSMFIFCVLKNYSRISVFYFFNCLLVFYYKGLIFLKSFLLLHRLIIYIIYSFPCLTYFMVFFTCYRVKISCLTREYSVFFRSVFIGCLIFILISSISAAVNLYNIFSNISKVLVSI